MRKFCILLLTLFHSTLLFSQINLTSGLTAYFPFNGNTLDASGNGNNATNFGAVLSSDKFGNPNSAYLFNGVNNYMQIANNATLPTNSFSICVLIKPLSYYNGLCFNNVILSKGNSVGYGSSDIGLSYTPTLNQNPQNYCTIQDSLHENYRVFAGNNSALNSLACITPINGIPYISTNNWNCVVGVYNDTAQTATIYVNSVLRYSYSVNPNQGLNFNDIFIGKQTTAGYEYWCNAVMDEIRIYNRTLNNQEIEALCTTCNTTNKINITTGIDVNDNQILFNNSSNLIDPLWKISNPAAGLPTTIGVNPPTAYIAKMQGTSLPWMLFPATTIGTPPPVGNWLAPFNDFNQTNNTNMTNTTTGYYEVNFDRYFTVCFADSFTIYCNYAADNYVDYIELREAQSNNLVSTISNGNLTNSSIPDYLNTLTPAPTLNIFLNPGKYYIRARVGNGPISSSFNPMSFYLNGFIESVNNFNSLITNSSDSACTNSASCGVNNFITPSLILIDDTINCNTTSTVLNATISTTQNVLGYSWMPISGLSNSNILNPIATPSSSTTYTLNVVYQSNINLIQNPNFNGLTNGFSSFYQYISPLAGSNNAQSQYTVGFNPYPWNNWAASCYDHTTGSGNMMIVNGASNPGVNVWSQTIAVQPNTNYVFSAWASSWFNQNPATLQFSINSNTIGLPFQLSSNTCQWNQFYQTWNSGPNTNATIEILNQNTNINGNDFSLDDLHFGKIDTLMDTLKITVLSSPIVSALTTDSNICINDSTTLFGQGASTYTWSNGVINGVPFYPNTTATYTVTGTDANGCTATSTITINVNALPIVNATANPQIICSNNPVTLNGSGALNYTWTGSVVNGIPFTPTVAGSYTVTGTDANGCTNTSSISISINSNPIISGSVNPTIICQGAPTTFNGSGGVTYTWSGGVSNGVPFYPNTSGNYTVTGTDANGCTGTSVVAITVLPKPTINANANPPIICNGQSTTLTGSGGVSYTWSGTITDGTPFQPSSTATYTVTGTDANGCSNTSTTSITVIQNIALTISPNNPSLCEGDSILLTATGASNYSWTYTPGLSNYNGASVWAHPNTSTTFTVNATDANGCSGTATINLVVDKDIEITATKNQDAECNVNLIQLSASGANNYTWSPSNLLSNPNGSVTNATITETTTFLVTGTSGACSDTDSVTVNYLIKNDIGTNIPNAFSPNYDGMNDCLHVITNEVYASFYFTIYNRWGEKIYETNDQNNCWEGFYENQRAPVGTYFYYLRAKSRCGEIFKKGDFILIR